MTTLILATALAVVLTIWAIQSVASQGARDELVARLALMSRDLIDAENERDAANELVGTLMRPTLQALDTRPVAAVLPIRKGDVS